MFLNIVGLTAIVGLEWVNFVRKVNERYWTIYSHRKYQKLTKISEIEIDQGVPWPMPASIFNEKCIKCNTEQRIELGVDQQNITSSMVTELFHEQ